MRAGVRWEAEIQCGAVLVALPALGAAARIVPLKMPAILSGRWWSGQSVEMLFAAAGGAGAVDLLRVRECAEDQDCGGSEWGAHPVDCSNGGMGSRRVVAVRGVGANSRAVGPLFLLLATLQMLAEVVHGYLDALARRFGGEAVDERACAQADGVTPI